MSLIEIYDSNSYAIIIQFQKGVIKCCLTFCGLSGNQILLYRTVVQTVCHGSYFINENEDKT